MLTFRQKILMLSEEEQVYLKCKICQKEFPKFDQRGFRNAGFTAHQNRCIEREYMLSHPVMDRQLSPPRQRLLLPVPSSSTSTLMNSSRSKSSSPVLQQQQQQLQQQQQYQQQQYQQQQQHQVQQFQQGSPTLYDAHHANAFKEPAGSFMVPNNEQQQQQQVVQEEGIDLSLFSHVNYSYPAAATITTEVPALPVVPVEMVFPISHCECCNPEFGLHQSSCLLLAEFLRQGSNMQ